MDFLKFLKNTIIFFVGSVLSKVITVILLPIYTSYIPPADMGYYDLSITYMHVFETFLFIDIWVITMRYMYESRDDLGRYKVINSGAKIFSVSTLILVALSVIFSFIVDVRYMYLVVLYAVTTNIQQLFVYVLRGFKKNVDFAVSGAINTLVALAMNILLIVVFKFDYSALYISAIVGNLVQCLYIQLRCNCMEGLRRKYSDRDLVREMLLVALPLCINSVAYWLLTSLNKIVLSFMYSTEVNGYYAIGNKFGSMLMLVTTCFNFAWQDLSFSRRTDDDSNSEYYSKACDTYLLFLGFGFGIMLPILGAVYPILVHDTYSESFITVPFFLLAALFSAYSAFVGNIFYSLKKTKAISVSMIISCIFNAIICYPLIKYFDIIGTQIALSLSFLLCVIIRYFVLNKFIKFRINLKNALLILLVVALAVAVYIFDNLWVSLGYSALLVAAIAIAERKYIANILRKFVKVKK